MRLIRGTHELTEHQIDMLKEDNINIEEHFKMDMIKSLIIALYTEDLLTIRQSTMPIGLEDTYRFELSGYFTSDLQRDELKQELTNVNYDDLEEMANTINTIKLMLNL